MKSFFNIAGLSTVLVVAAPLFAQAAQPYGNGPNNHNDQNRTHETITVTKTQVHVNQDYNGYRTRRGHIMPLVNVVAALEKRTGATVTDIQLAKNGKVYNFEGVTSRGYIVKANADAFTGKVMNVQSTKYRPKYDPKGISITRLLGKLRQQGFRDFDFVSLKEQQGVYVVRGLNRIGVPVQILANAKTGNIYAKKAVNQYYGPSYARSEYRDFDSLRPGLEQKRYSRFENVTAYDDYYTADARDEKGRTVQLIINAFTGALLSQ